MRRLILLACLLLLPLPPAEAKPSKKAALKLLKMLKQVDGAGSGLDADTVRGVAPLVVKDAQGKLVGTVIDAIGASESRVTVARTVGGAPVTFLVFTDHVEGTSAYGEVGNFGYATADCSGPRLRRSDSPRRRPCAG